MYIKTHLTLTETQDRYYYYFPYFIDERSEAWGHSEGAEF